MNYTSKQWRGVVRFVDIAAVVVVVFVLALIGQHYVRFNELIFPLEGLLFLFPLPVLRAIATKERKKSEAREAVEDPSV